MWGLLSAHLVPSVLSSPKAHVPERLPHSWKFWGFSDTGHLASVAGGLPVSGLGSQHATVLGMGAGLVLSATEHPEGLRVWPSGVSQRVWAQSRRQETRPEAKGPLRGPAWPNYTCPRSSHSCPLAPSRSRWPQSLGSQEQGLQKKGETE